MFLWTCPRCRRRVHAMARSARRGHLSAPHRSSALDGAAAAPDSGMHTCCGRATVMILVSPSLTIFRAARGRLPRAMVRLWGPYGYPPVRIQSGDAVRAVLRAPRGAGHGQRAAGQRGHTLKRVARRGRCRLFYSGCNTAHLSLSPRDRGIDIPLPTHPDTPTPLAPPTTPHPVIAPQDPPCPRSERPPDSERGSLLSGESREMPCRLRSG